MCNSYFVRTSAPFKKTRRTDNKMNDMQLNCQKICRPQVYNWLGLYLLRLAMNFSASPPTHTIPSMNVKRIILSLPCTKARKLHQVIIFSIFVANVVNTIRMLWCTIFSVFQAKLHCIWQFLVLIRSYNQLNYVCICKKVNALNILIQKKNKCSKLFLLLE